MRNYINPETVHISTLSNSEKLMYHDSFELGFTPHKLKLKKAKINRVTHCPGRGSNRVANNRKILDIEDQSIVKFQLFVKFHLEFILVEKFCIFTIFFLMFTLNNLNIFTVTANTCNSLSSNALFSR